MAKIGTVGYLNARPLSDRIDVNLHTLVMAHPSEVARMLRDGEVDVALVPVAAALTDGDFRMVPRVAIGAEGPVHSVVLVGETPPEQWRRVRLDGVSRTSRVLARLLLTRGPLAERVRDDLVIEDVPPNEALQGAGGDVGALVIGDAARVLDTRWSVRIDLAEVWHSWTGLPFVFAVWAGRPDLDPRVVDHLAVAGEAGVAAVPHTYAGKDLHYLTQNLRYTLDDKALMGLRRFAAMAHQAGLVAREDVELYGPGEARIPHPAVDAVLERALAGERLADAEVAMLFEHAPLSELAAAAHELRMQRHPSSTVPYVVGGLAGGEGADPWDAQPVAVGVAQPVVEQLLALRERQDRDGDVQAVRVWAPAAEGPYGSTPNTAADHLRAVALARIVLDNVTHCLASPATEGLGMAQASLRMGCDHLGAVLLEGEADTWPRQLEAVELHIREAGFEPVRQELGGRPERRESAAL